MVLVWGSGVTCNWSLQLSARRLGSTPLHGYKAGLLGAYDHVVQTAVIQQLVLGVGGMGSRSCRHPSC